MTAFLFSTWQRIPCIKEEELKELSWDIRRNLAKINHRIHIDAIQEDFISPELTPQQFRLDRRFGSGCFGMTLSARPRRNGATAL